MGHYIEVPVKKGKAEYLIKNHRAEMAWHDSTPAPHQWLVCIVENGHWEAALIVFDEIEHDRAKPTHLDTRPRTWLVIPKTECADICLTYHQLLRQLERTS